MRTSPYKYEWEALLEWHLEQQYVCANKEEYDEAADHKKRAEEIREIIKIPECAP
jgi:hypothetical protein